MTNPERIAKHILESLGFTIIPFEQKKEYDQANTIYMQVPFGNMKLDFAIIKAQIAEYGTREKTT